MKFKVGDRVRITNVTEEVRLGALGAVGVIVDVDAEWIYPYEIAFEEEKYKEFNALLFLEKELVLASEEKSKPQSKYIDIKFQKDYSDCEGASVEEVIDILIDKVKEMHNNGLPTLDVHMSSVNIVSKLMESKMWLRESRKSHERKVKSLEESSE